MSVSVNGGGGGCFVSFCGCGWSVMCCCFQVGISIYQTVVVSG